MSELSITNADELDVMSGDATVVVIMDDEVDVITTMEQGPPGPPGPPGPASIVAGPPGATGPAGPRGNSVLYGAVDPASGTGVNGDFYINTTTHFMFGPKTSGLWGAGYSIIGPAGPQGPTGPQGPIGLQGPVGPRGTDGTNGNTVLYGAANPTAQGANGDFYINTTTNFIFGPKAGGAWPGGVSLVGPQGPIGLTGAQGPQGVKGDKGDTGPQGAAGTATLLVSDTPPAGAADGSMWFESDTGLVYARYNDGTSTQWVIVTPQPDLSLFVAKAGDAMTGDLTINDATPTLYLNKAAAGAPASIFGQMGGLNRFALVLGNVSPESGGNAGSDFGVIRYTDAGAIIDAPFVINRASGAAIFSGNIGAGATAYSIDLDGAAATTRAIVGTTNGVFRWRTVLGNAAAETGANAGSDFYIQRYADNGAVIDNPLVINRATGTILITIAGPTTGPCISGPTTSHRGIFGQTNTINRWQLILGNSSTESGSNAGSDFFIQRFSDAGALINNPLNITRSTGVATFAAAIVNGPSDRTLKENIAPLEGSLAKVLALQGVRFNMIETPDKPEIGLIAQDVAPIVPEVIQEFAHHTGPEKMTVEPKLAIDYPKLTALLIEAVKELTARIAVLEGGNA